MQPYEDHPDYDPEMLPYNLCSCGEAAPIMLDYFDEWDFHPCVGIYHKQCVDKPKGGVPRMARVKTWMRHRWTDSALLESLGYEC